MDEQQAFRLAGLLIVRDKIVIVPIKTKNDWRDDNEVLY